MKRVLVLSLLFIPPAMCQHAQHMHSMYGRYTIDRDASGTSWQPDLTPMFAIHGNFAGWQTMLHGIVNIVGDHEAGPRGDEKLFSTNMVMLTGQRDFGDVTIGLRSMFSGEPFTVGKSYPLLLQTGETANGITPLIDRQHPHDLFMELAFTAAYERKNGETLYCYIGYPGEPALGPPAFMHRFTGMDNPQAPISHHWLDSTHITYGVATLGYIWNNFKIEASAFKGREPDEDRFTFEPPKLDSFSVRASYNPIPALSFQVSFGHIISPEQLDPCENVNRITASAMYHHRFSFAQWQTLFAWGRNYENPGHTLDAFLLESEIILLHKHTIFGRLERVQKDDLFLAPSPFFNIIFPVKKASIGYIYDFSVWHSIAWGFGAGANVSIVPRAIKGVYGGSPFSYLFFFRAKIV